MIGFMKKDIAMVKSNIKILGILIILYVLMGFSGDVDMSFIVTFMSVMLMLSTFSYDNYNKWDAYSVSLPDGRRNGVRAKYVVTLLLILIVSLITITLSCIISYTSTKVINFEQILPSMVGTIFGCLLVMAFMYPIIYKFGVEKARIGIFIIVFGLAIISGFASQFLDLSNLAKALSFIEDYLVIILAIVSIIMVYISYRISLMIQMKKEF